jgi:hypothetical protein
MRDDLEHNQIFTEVNNSHEIESDCCSDRRRARTRESEMDARRRTLLIPTERVRDRQVSAPQRRTHRPISLPCVRLDHLMKESQAPSSLTHTDRHTHIDQLTRSQLQFKLKVAYLEYLALCPPQEVSKAQSLLGHSFFQLLESEEAVESDEMAMRRYLTELTRLKCTVEKKKG